MNTDSLKLVFTYSIAAIVIVGGGLFLFATMDRGASAESTRLAMVGFMGAAIAFVFAQEAATRATRAAQSSMASGNGNGTPPDA